MYHFVKNPEDLKQFLPYYLVCDIAQFYPSSGIFIIALLAKQT